jgi:aspartate carbamoyltransferase catalytic subunit
MEHGPRQHQQHQHQSADNNQNVVQQVSHAALAMVRPHTDSQTRAAASAFLENWTRTRESWHVYGLWLRESQPSLLQHASAINTDSSSSSLQEAMGMVLLCLQLLKARFVAK